MPGENSPYTQLDANQVLQQVFDETKDRLRVDTEATITATGQVEVAIDQSDDSIRIGDGINLVTATILGSTVALDVNIANDSLNIGADGVYNGSTNPNPDNIGLIASQRNATPSQLTQTQRLTSVTNGSTRALDVSLSDEDGAAYSATNPLDVLLRNSSGTEIGTISNPVRVDPTGTTVQPVSATQSGVWTVQQGTPPWSVTVASSALPTGAATAGKQDIGNASLASIDSDIDVALSTRASEVTLQSTNTKLDTLITQTDSIESLLTTGNTNTSNIAVSTASIDADIDVPLSTRASEATLSSLNTKVNNNFGVATGAVRTAAQLGNASGSADFGAGTTSAQTIRVVLPTNQSSIPVTQSGSWTVTATQGTTPWIVDGSATVQPVSGTVTVLQPTGTNLHVVVDSSALPTGASTSALQTSGNVSLSSIDSKLNSLGQKLSAASVPVVIASDQSIIPVSVTGSVSATQGTSPWVVSGTVNSVQSGVWTTGRTWDLSFAADQVDASGSSVSVSNFPAVQPVSGTVTATQGTSPWVVSGTVAVSNFPATQAVTQSTSPWIISGAVTGPLTDTQLRATPVPISGTVTTTQGTSPWVVSGTVAATQSGVWSTGRTWTLASGTDSVAAVQSGTWTVQPGNTANTTPWLSTINQGGNSATVTASNALKVDGSAVIQPVSGTVTVTQGTSPWVISGTVTANIGTTNGLALDTTLSALSAKFNSLGQKTMANSAPVVLASDQSAIPVTQSGSWTVTSTQGTSPWVTNVSQFGGNAVVTGTGAAGVGIPRVTVSNDSNILATQSGTWNITNVSGTVSLPTGASTAALQTTGNASLASIDTDFDVALSTRASAVNQTNGTQKTQVIDASGNVQPAGDTAARSRFERITDGTNTAAVKAASTVAVAADQSLVVALSPNSFGNVYNRLYTPGTTAQFNGTASTVAANVPAADGNNIVSAIIDNLSTTIQLLVSMDNGTTFKSVNPQSQLALTLFGSIKHFVIKSASGSVVYETIINRE